MTYSERLEQRISALSKLQEKLGQDPEHGAEVVAFMENMMGILKKAPNSVLESPLNEKLYETIMGITGLPSPDAVDTVMPMVSTAIASTWMDELSEGLNLMDAHDVGVMTSRTLVLVAHLLGMEITAGDLQAADDIGVFTSVILSDKVI